MQTPDQNIIQNTRDIPLLLVTANVGSIFEDPDVLLPSWMNEFLKTIRKIEPKFLALHCQEVGGKNYEESMKHVAHFVRSLIDSEELRDFIHVKIFLDEDFTSTAKFTALGNLYFIHSSVTDCQIWDFKEQTFLSASGRDIFTGNIEDVPIKEKDKFPKEFFPECKWSRKGFLRTRWKISGTTFDLINIHLFHDASNFTAMESFPSAYTRTRQHALDYTLNRLTSENNDDHPKPFFLFGDFNFRLNTGAVIKKITNDVIPDHVTHEEKGHLEKLLYKKSKDEDPFLTVAMKVFDLTDKEDVFYQSQNHSWLLEHDHEYQSFKDRLFEFDITFPPSYPFTEDSCGTTYMKTRCPAWCDRILLSHSAKDVIKSGDESNPSPIYQMMGADVPMGDHKPILLLVHLKSGNDACARTCPPSAQKSEISTTHTLRFRTNSNPSDWRRPVKSEARRISSFLPEISRPDSVHSSAWLSRTEELLRELRLKGDPLVSLTNTRRNKPRLTRVSSRLTSHHSSSDEEWYEDMNLLPETLSESPDTPRPGTSRQNFTSCQSCITNVTAGNETINREVTKKSSQSNGIGDEDKSNQCCSQCIIA